jgi:uncharacterized membrane protein YheB (UPF0754 family)
VVGSLLLLANLVWWLYRTITAFSGDALMGLLLTLAVYIIFFYARMFALRVQDRVIRLEMKLRLREVLPPELARRFNEFTVKQLVALRFASDAELPALCTKVLNDRMTRQKEIKKLVKDWQGDYLRA